MVKHDDAEKVFGLIDAAIIQTADKSNVYSHAAKICIEKEDFRQADAFLERAIDLMPSNVEALVTSAKLFYNRGNLIKLPGCMTKYSSMNLKTAKHF